jgi:PST family polysaccharide transporter
MKIFIPTLAEIRFALKDSSTYFLSRISTSLYSTTNTFVLGLTVGDVFTAYYKGAETLYQAYGTLVDPFTKVLFPYMSRTRNTVFFKRSLAAVIAINILLLTGVYIFSEDIIRLYYHPFAPEVLQVFRILMLATIFSIPHMLVGYPLIAALGHPHYANGTVVATSVFHIAMIGVLLITGSLSIYTVAVLVVCSECILAMLRFYGIRKYGLFRDFR